jgi:hypothetical protein
LLLTVNMVNIWEDECAAIVAVLTGHKVDRGTEFSLGFTCEVGTNFYLSKAKGESSSCK